MKAWVQANEDRMWDFWDAEWGNEVWPSWYSKEEHEYMGRENDNKWDRREQKHRKSKHGMRVSGRSVKDLQRIIVEKAKKIKDGK